MTHQNILNRTADYMRSLDPERMPEWRTQLEELREHRELFSYRFPLSGPELAGNRALDVEAATSLGRLDLRRNFVANQAVSLASILSESNQARRTVAGG